MKTLNRMKQHVERARQTGRNALQQLFEPHLRTPEAWRACRNTPYALERTFWLFLWQTFAGDKSCTEAVGKHAAGWPGRTPSPNTGAYCKARGRLPTPDLEEIERATADALHRPRESEGRWRGRRVRVIDGSTLTLPDTPPNQAAYPQPHGQAPGCGFPMMRLVVVFSLATGGILAFAKSSLKISERALFRTLWSILETADVLLADRGFCSYADCYLLKQRGVDYVLRKHQSRTVGVTVRKRLGRHDALVEWHKTAIRPPWMDQEQWRAMPDTLSLREITVHVDIPGFRTQVFVIVTSLLNHKAFPAQAFAELYRRRWLAELFLRDIKTSQGMDILRCKTPEMTYKELLMHLIAYNLLRATLLEAARGHTRKLFRQSFKTALSALRHWAPRDDDPSPEQGWPTRLLKFLARALIPYRPNRVEPRAVKRRPKEYDRLNKPRHLLRQMLLQNTPQIA